MRFFRGIAVPAKQTASVIDEIKTRGLYVDQGERWTIEQVILEDVASLLAKPDLSIEDTRPQDGRQVRMVCACGDEASAAYYALHHNRSEVNDTPIVIEFDSDPKGVIVDGKDFLYTVFSLGDPDRARPVLRTAFGERSLHYAEKAWEADAASRSIALCDLAIRDPLVIEAHYRNTTTLGGRYRIPFLNAFMIMLPIMANQIIDVRSPGAHMQPRAVDIELREILRAR